VWTTLGGEVSDMGNQAEKDLEEDPQLKQDAEKDSKKESEDIEGALKKDL
jgi:hypothetical protein